MITPIVLTNHQRESVEWAFGAMDEYWGTCNGGPVDLDAEGVQSSEGDFSQACTPRLFCENLWLSNHEEINDDLCYRLGTQLPAMMEELIGEDQMSQQRFNSQSRSLKLLVEAIKAHPI